MGLMQSDITTTGVNQTGFVITEGLLQGLNTAGQTAGDPVWLGVNGALIYGLINKPYAPAHLVFIGIVTKISAGNGEIFVKVQNGFELKEIHDVDIITTTPVNGQVLGFDGTLWVNKTVAGWLGFTAENTANKQNSLATDGTGVKFPTVDAVNSLSMIDRGKRMASFFFDFMNGSEPYITSNSVSGSITIPTQTTVPNLTSNQLGIIQYSTNLVATSYTYHFSQFTNHLWFGGGICNFETSVEMANLSTALERFRTLHGFASATNSQSEANGAFFTYDEGGVVNGTVASANWQCVTVNNNTRTLTTTTIPVTTTWTKLRVEVNAAGTSVAFYVNGTLAATHTTNIPLFSQSRFVFVKQGMAKVIGITARVMYCDYFGYETISTTPRT
jgi:hypothetical protein